MNFLDQPTQHYLNYKLKSISLVVFSIFAHFAYAQNANTVEAITGEKPNPANPIDIPSVATQYGTTKKTLLAAEVKDAKLPGTGKSDSQGNPISNAPVDINLKAVTVRAKRFHQIGPMPGLALTKEEIPGNVQSISAKEIKNSHSLSLTDLMNKNLQSINVNDYQGNPFQMDVTYRGFTASPQVGTAQGLSVFFDGIRVNEPFGDVVNWDMIPLNALAGLDVFPGSNPIFGLGTLGGALAMRTKNGFEHTGVDAEVLAGSFGRKQFQLSVGGNNGVVAGFGALSLFDENGWRDNSPSKVNQAFGKLTYRNENLNINFSTLLAGNDLVGNGLIPSDLYKQRHDSVFTSPDETKNRLKQFQLSGEFFVNDSFSITGQVYRRDSVRKSINGDVYTDFGPNDIQSRRLNSGENAVCGLQDTNQDGIPDYYEDVLEPDPDNPGNYLNSTFLDDYGNDGVPNFNRLPVNAFNKELPPDYKQRVLQQIAIDFNPDAQFTTSSNNSIPPVDWPSIDDGFGGSTPAQFFQMEDVTQFSAFPQTYYIDDAGKKHNLYIVPSITPSCANYAIGEVTKGIVRKNYETVSNEFGTFATTKPRDGAFENSASQFTGTGTGVVEGTPTAIITNTTIDQITDGASVQFNWNTDHHKLMLGASIDKSNVDYQSGQRLGLLDLNRNAYLAPESIGREYAAASQEIRANDFDGKSTTKSLYLSETWTPVETWHFTGSARYNQTKVKNNLAVRAFDFDLGEFTTGLLPYVLCPSTNPTSCPSGESGSYYKVDYSKFLREKESEKFSYYSLNPSLGASWEPNKNLNLYANWNQGTRTPSVIELGCAFDATPVNIQQDSSLPPIFKPRSIAEHRFCSLPSTMSGDPYLPQVKAQTFELGARGRFTENLEWNLGAYHTGLKDDIYFVSFTGGRSFFQSIGETVRRGIEAGLSGSAGKAKFKINYSLTDATFEDSFKMLSANNSSAGKIAYGQPDQTGDFQQIKVTPGSRMPGIPLHNLNASVSYDVTDKWNIGLSAVAHSWSYLRGNENNQHQVGAPNVQQLYDGQGGAILLTRQPFNNPGKISGYTVFNLQSSYKLDKGLTLGLQVNNLFNHQYFSAGRLGVNPFSPQINGAIGPSGYNHNSNDWLNANFIAPGAPRGIWATLNYEFWADK